MRERRLSDKSCIAVSGETRRALVLSFSIFLSAVRFYTLNGDARRGAHSERNRYRVVVRPRLDRARPSQVLPPFPSSREIPSTKSSKKGRPRFCVIFFFFFQTQHRLCDVCAHTRVHVYVRTITISGDGPQICQKSFRATRESHAHAITITSIDTMLAGIFTSRFATDMVTLRFIFLLNVHLVNFFLCAADVRRARPLGDARRVKSERTRVSRRGNFRVTKL